MAPAAPCRPAWLADDPHAWRPGTLDRARFDQAVSELAQRPGFDVTARRFAGHWVGAQESHPALRTVMRNSPRYLLLVVCLVMHHERDPRDAMSGITPGRVLDFFERVVRGRVNAGATQVKTMLSHAQVHGLLCPVSGSGDARLRRLEPTPLMQQAMARWVYGFAQAMWGCLHLPEAPQVMVQHPGLVGEIFAYRLAAMTQDGFALTEGQPTPQWLMAHDRGYRLFLHLVRAIQPQSDGGAVIALSVSELAAQAWISRGTVRKVLAGLQARDWLDADDDTQTLRLNRTQLSLWLNWIARELVWMHGLATAAWSRIPKPPATGAVGASA